MSQQEIIEEIKRKMKNTPPGQFTVEQEPKKEEQKEEPKKAKKIKSRRIVKLMFSKCPLCYEKLKVVDMDQMERIKGFKLIQFGSNPDDTGFETYWCDFCMKFFLMFISPVPINVQAMFSTIPPQRKQGPQAKQDNPQ
jgi:hypothetical protein